MIIRDALNSDLPKIASLAQRNGLLVGDLDERQFPSMLNWLYVENPASIQFQFVAEDEGRIVAHYGAVPIAYKILHHTCIAGFASNLVIAENKRAGMLFFSLQSHLQREYQRRGFGFLYGLVTRKEVLEPHRRAGWKTVGVIPVYLKPHNFPKVAAGLVHNSVLLAAMYVPLKLAEWISRIRIRRSRQVTITEVTEFGAGIDDFIISFMNGVNVSAIRTREALNWRFTGCKGRTYRIFTAYRQGRAVGYAVTRRMRLKSLDAFALVDIAFLPDDHSVARSLLDRCTDEAIKSQADATATIANAQSFLVKHLRKSGFLRTHEAFTLVVKTPKHMPGPGLAEALFPQWHLTWYEHDYV